jgi:hypothetical protein
MTQDTPSQDLLAMLDADAYASWQFFPLVCLDGAFTLEKLEAFVAAWRAYEDTKQKEQPS